MLTEQEVIAIAKNYVLERSQQSGYDLVILDNAEIKKPYGIIFRLPQVNKVQFKLDKALHKINKT